MSNERVAKLIFYSEFQGIKLKKKAKKYVVIEYLLDKCIKNDLYRAYIVTLVHTFFQRKLGSYFSSVVSYSYSVPWTTSANLTTSFQDFRKRNT